jgi:hypothetical protein
MRELLHTSMTFTLYSINIATKKGSDISESDTLLKIEGVSGNLLGDPNLMSWKTDIPCHSKLKFLYI